MTSSKKHNVREFEYIDILPKKVIPITKYKAYSGIISEFNRYWWDPINSRIIMKPKNMKKYKIINPMIDKQDCRFTFLYDIYNFRVWVNYDKLINQILNKQYVDKYSYVLK